MSDTINLEKIVEYFANENDKSCKLLLKKWSKLKEITRILKIAYNLTIVFQSQKLTLCDVYEKWLGMQLHFEHLIRQQNEKNKLTNSTGLATYLLQAARNRNQNIFKNPLMLCALFLHPRYHCEAVKNSQDTSIVKEKLLNIWRRLNVLGATHDDHEKKSLDTTLDFDYDEAISQYLQPHNSSKNTLHGGSAPNPNDDIEMVIDLYQPEPQNGVTSILEYWESKKEHPLYKIAMAIYSVPPTEVQIERDFSQLDFVFTKRRGNLDHLRLEDIMLLHLNKDLFYVVKTEEINDLLAMPKQ